MPADPTRRPFSSADLADVRAELAQLAVDVARGPADGRCDLEHRLHELGVDARLELVPGDGGEDGVDVLDEVECLAVQQHVLLLDAERVGVAVAEVVVEHAAAGREALARDRGGVDLLHALVISEHGVGLDLDPPARVEEALDDDPGRGRADLAEDLAVRAPDLVELVRVDHVHPGPDDVLRPGAGPLERGEHDLEAQARLLVDALRRFAAVRGDGRRARDVDVAPGHDRARVADDGLHRRVAGDAAALHAASIARSWTP